MARKKKTGDQKDQRAYERFDHEAPIKYAVTDIKDYKGATMQNCSEGGMYFESSKALKPGDDIHITRTDVFEGCRAEVRWCRKRKAENKKLFGVGVQYHDPDKSHQEDYFESSHTMMLQI